jgi:hypothetical protein
MDEGNIPPGATLRVKLLEYPRCNHLHNIGRPAATECGACHRPWARHREKSIEMVCELCDISARRCTWRCTRSMLPRRAGGPDRSDRPPGLRHRGMPLLRGPARRRAGGAHAGERVSRRATDPGAPGQGRQGSHDRGAAQAGADPGCPPDAGSPTPARYRGRPWVFLPVHRSRGSIRRAGLGLLERSLYRIIPEPRARSSM